jgi:hypothetical protein
LQEEENAETRCKFCGGTMLDWLDQGASTPLATHLGKVRERLTDHTSHAE